MDRLFLIMLSKSDDTSVVCRRVHFYQVIVQIMLIFKEEIAEQAVYGKNSLDIREIFLYFLQGIRDDLVIISNLHQCQNVKIVYLFVTFQCVVFDVLDRNQICFTAVDTSKWIFKCLGSNFFF